MLSRKYRVQINILFLYFLLKEAKSSLIQEGHFSYLPTRDWCGGNLQQTNHYSSYTTTLLTGIQPGSSSDFSMDSNLR